MGPIQLISAHQQKMLRTDGRLLLARVITWGLCGVALLNGWLFFARQHQARLKAQADSYAQWLSQPPKNAHSAAHYGFYVYRPLSSLSILDKGMDDYLGTAVWLEAHNQNEVKARAVQDFTFLARFGNLTLGFVWVVLFPLVILLLSFNVISAEREQGTYKLLLVNGGNLYNMMLAKFKAIYSITLGLFLPVFCLAAGLMALAAPKEFPGLLPHLFVLLGCLGLYYAFLVIVGISASAGFRNSGLALLGLLSIWIVTAFIWPRLTAFVAHKAYPAKTAFDFTQEMKAETKKGAKERAKNLEQEYLAKYGVDSVKHLPINFVGVSLQASEEYGDKIHDRFYGQLLGTFQQQDQFIAWGSLLSPITAMHNIIMALSGTDNDTDKAFIGQAEKHRRLIQRTMNQAIVTAPKDVKGAIPMAETSLWAKVPPFTFQPLSIWQIMAHQWPNLLALVAWLGAAVYIFKKQSFTPFN